MAYNPLVDGNDAGPELLNKANPMFQELYQKTEVLGESINSLAAKVIAESGSNANGNYIKFEDGTMICSASLLLSDVEHTIASGSIFMNSEVIWTYPASFISSASVSGSCTNLAYGKGWLSFFATNSTTQAKYSIMSSMSGTTPSVRVSLIAIGRWK